MRQIKSFYITYLLVPTHLGFHKGVVRLIKQAGVAELHLETLLPAYEEAVLLQFEHISRPLYRANTQNIQRKDESRDFYVRRFLKTVKDFCRSPDEEERLQARTFWRQVSPYDGIPATEKHKQTALIQRFLDDMNTDENKEIIQKMELTATVDKIRAYNFQFNEEMKQRIHAHSQRVPFNMQKHRKITDAHYHTLVKHVNAYSIVMPSAAIDDFIDLLNAHIGEFKSVIAHMRPGGSGNERRKIKTKD